MKWDQWFKAINVSGSLACLVDFLWRLLVVLLLVSSVVLIVALFQRARPELIQAPRIDREQVIIGDKVK